MTRRGLGGIVVAIYAALTGAASADEPQCFDVAVVAKLKHEVMLAPFKAGPNEIILGQPWRQTFIVMRHIAGSEHRSQVDAVTVKETHANRRVRYWLLFLRHVPGQDYALAGAEVLLARDSSGQFVIPFAEPMPKEALGPGSFIPANYEALLRPVHYRVEDAWWLTTAHLDPDGDNPIKPADYPWGRVTKTGVVADRGLAVADLVDALADRRCKAK